MISGPLALVENAKRRRGKRCMRRAAAVDSSAIRFQILTSDISELRVRRDRR